MDPIVETLQNILLLKGHSYLSSLLYDSSYEIIQSGQYGSKWNSIISKFVIYLPVQNYFKLRNYFDSAKELLLECVRDIYPVTDDAPEIVAVEFRILIPGTNTKVDFSSQAINEESLRKVFISYSTQNSALAGQLKIILEEMGFDAFLAHEDINPSAEWQETILNILGESGIFIPIITESYHGSNWTDQESGIAMYTKKIVLPICVVGCKPYGFLSKYQAMFIAANDVNSITADSIYRVLVKVNPVIAKRLLSQLLISFSESQNYFQSGAKSELILRLFSEKLDKKDVNKIFESFLANSQIRECILARPNLYSLFQRHRKAISPTILNRIRDVVPKWFS
ncbi:MAG: toll/interleukin-1 receptor domain-containing protein [Patescibacteria group bacterium]|nr:toll/interleukin-1 receptor domain-containing protein [Patescibacteria group bacterium]